MKPEAILFIDVNDTAVPVYTYREPHFAAARRRGLTCLTAAWSGHRQRQRLEADSDEVFWLPALSAASLDALLRQLAERYQVRAVLCHAGHASPLGQMGCLVADLCQRHGLVYSTAQAVDRCNNKFLMRQALARAGVRSVAYALCHDEAELQREAERVGYPLIAKPPYGAASAFIRKCLDWPQLQAYYRTFLEQYDRASVASFYGESHHFTDLDGHSHHYVPGRSVLLESYIDGVEGSVECVATAQAVFPVLINEKLLLTTQGTTVLENLLITPPAAFSDERQQQIREYAVACLQAVGLTYAVAHVEFRMTASGPVVIEVNPRLGGLYVNAAFQDIAGLDPYDLYLSLLLAQDGVEESLRAACERAAQNRQHYSMFAIYPPASGYFQGFHGLPWVERHPAVVAFGHYPVGHYVDADIEEHYLFKGWARVASAEDAQALYDALQHHLRPMIDPQPSVVADGTLPAPAAIR
ncbi:ATP-grasp domain-containing protein [Dickeya dadantii subsp. dieffenbachiae]|uniref:ATP-grasp domain-containing protein n=1 Tax=Dickeya dadantii TaxID=204038 RepID=UPI00039B4C7B|nr:ATP-grasp domain-containing protein [Dickeya dadantii]